MIARPTRQIGKLAVIDPTGNSGGATRFIRALLPALQRVRPGLRTTFFGNGEAIHRDDIGAELAEGGVSLSTLEWVSTRPWRSRPLATRLAYKFRSRMAASTGLEAHIEANLIREVQAIVEGSDVAFFPWPYQMPVPKLDVAMVTTIHDLNFKYFFGTPIFSARDTEILDRRVLGWLVAAHAVASSQFMADEIARFYPSSKPTPVVRLAPFASARPLDQPNAAAIVAGFGIDYPYLLCPTHLPVHKNLGPLIAGVAILRDKFPHLRLVLTGVGTQAATGRATAIGTVRDDGSPDVIGLGYVTNTQIDSLIECASVVVNPSLYEAGNGSGLDAWSRETPVAMSDIPAFAEHLTALGVSAALFDPRSPNDIAAKIGEILENEPRWRGLAHTSREALQTLTWDGVARGYLDVFDAAFDGASRG